MRKKYKDLTEEDKEYLSQMYYEAHMSHKEKMSILRVKYGVTSRTIRRWWKENLNLTEKSSKLPKQLIDAENNKIEKDVDIVLCTSAQNKTSILLNGLKNMEKYAEYLTEKGFKTQIVVTPSRYRNPTSLIESDKHKTEQWWRDEVVPYLHYGKIMFGDTLISADSRVRPTAKEPLTGYELMAKNNHLIIPHSKIHFKTLPRFKNKPLRSMLTTGFITHRNYSESKSGDQAHENHSYGFIVIEKKTDGTCHIPRNVKMDNHGNFYDLCFSVVDGKVNVVDNSKALIWGDIHSRVVDNEIFDKTIRLSKLVKPNEHILHDVFDGSTVNPHESKDMYIQRRKIKENKHLIDEEVQESFDVIEKIKVNTPNSKINITLSNHDVFLDRLVNDANWKRDLHNSPTYLKYAYIQQTVDLEKYGNIYGYLLSNKFTDGKVKYYKYNESLDISGYECGSHGDFGVNGSRGNYKTFSRLNTKMIHGHSHSPVIHNGVTVVGVTCKLHQYYNKRGMSSWAHAHSIIHNNNKNQLLVFGDDKQISSLIRL